MTEYEFGLYRSGFHKKEMAEWERTRFVAWMVQATQSTKPVKIEDILPLPIDEERKIAREKAKPSKKVTDKKYNDILARLGKK